MSDFNLRALIREVCDASSDAEPDLLVKAVLAKIERRDTRAALEQALPSVVQSVISSHRFMPDRPQIAPAGQTRGDAHRTVASGGAKPQRSSKVAGIRDTIGRILRERISVGPARTDWKFLGDCTADDLDFAAKLREDLAASNAYRAAQLRDLAAAVRESGVVTVRDLPDVADRLSEAA